MNILPRNENNVERILRVAVGVGALVFAFTEHPMSAWGYLGLIPLLTGVVGSCPLYTVFGFSTCGKRNC